MRLSSDYGDPGYRAWRALLARGVKVRVYVDGVEQKRCKMADTKRGIAVVYEVDEAGHLALNARRDAVRRKLLRGRVRIVVSRAKAT